MTPFVARSLLVSGAAMAARLFFVLWASFPAGDSGDYHAIALNLISGHGYALFAESPTMTRTPGYPLFLAAIYALGGDVRDVFVAQVLLGGLGAWFLYLLARRHLPDRVATAGALLAGVAPHLAFYAGTLLGETLAFPLAALALLGTSSLALGSRTRGVAFATGVAYGALALVSSYFAFLPLGAAAVLLIARVPFRSLLRVGALLALGYGLTFAPWVVRNMVTFGVFVPLTLPGKALILWAASDRMTLYDYDYDRRADGDLVLARWLVLFRSDPTREREWVPERQAVEDALTTRAIDKIRADPLGYLADRARWVPAEWIQPAIYVGNFKAPFKDQNLSLGQMLERRLWPSVALRLASIGLFTIGLFAGLLLGIWALRRQRVTLMLLLFPAAYIAIFLSAMYIEHRYSAIAQSFLWLVSSAGWAAAIRTLIRRVPPPRSHPSSSAGGR